MGTFRAGAGSAHGSGILRSEKGSTEVLRRVSRVKIRGRKVARLASFLRIDEWLYSKTPMMMGCFLYFVLRKWNRGETTRTEVWSVTGQFAALLLFVCLFLAFSYVINDWSDLDADRRAGKQKVMTEMTDGGIVLSLAGLAAAGSLPVLLGCHFSPTLCGVILFVYFWGAVYSVRPLRFKERGAAGLVECAAAQRCCPLLVIPFLVTVQPLDYAAWMVLSFLDGMKYILIHQALDADSDRRTGIRTFLVGHSSFPYRKVLMAVYLAETALTGWLIAAAGVRNPLLFAAAAADVAVEAVFYRVIHVYAGKEWLYSFDAVPLETMLNVAVPLGLSVSLALREPAAIILTLLLLVVVWWGLPPKGDILRVYIRVQREHINSRGQSK